MGFSTGFSIGFSSFFTVYMAGTSTLSTDVRSLSVLSVLFMKLS
jgi:hypothetical protein